MVLPDEAGVMTLPNATLFPQSMLPLYIFEPRYRRMLKEALESHRMFCIAMRKANHHRDVPEQVAGLGMIRAAVDHDDGTSHLVLEGVSRVMLDKVVRYRPYRIQRIHPIVTASKDSVMIDALMAKIRELVAERLDLVVKFPFTSGKAGSKKEQKVRLQQLRDVLKYLNQMDNPSNLADMVACTLLTDAHERQAILSTMDVENRLHHLVRYLGNEIRRLKKSPPSEGEWC